MPRARPASSAAPADAASPDRWRTAGIPSTDVRTSTHNGRPVPAPPRVTPWAVCPPSRPAVTTSMQRSTSQATDSITARDRSSMPCAAPRPTNPARASSRHHGARAPSNQGTAVTPRAPGGLLAARVASSSTGRSSSRPSQARNDPAAERPPSSNQPSLAPRVTTAPAGEGTGRSCTGTDTLAVVPQLTMGHSSDAPEPRTSHWRSPAPITIGVPGRRPSSAPGTALRCPITVSDATTLGSLPRAGPASSRTALPSKS
jgi:hypothetical protein